MPSPSSRCVSRATLRSPRAGAGGHTPRRRALPLVVGRRWLRRRHAPAAPRGPAARPHHAIRARCSNEAPRRHERTSRVAHARPLDRIPGTPTKRGCSSVKNAFPSVSRRAPSTRRLESTQENLEAETSSGAPPASSTSRGRPGSRPRRSCPYPPSVVAPSERAHDPIEIVRVKMSFLVRVEQFKGLVDAIDVERRL